MKLGLEKPFNRIIRPFRMNEKEYPKWIKQSNSNYINDSKYFREGISLIEAFKNIEKDLIDLFRYIEPDSNNNKVFSHRIYELLLRTCTEVEANCKGILKANDYNVKKWDMMKYRKINEATKLSEYSVIIKRWRRKELILKPFENWRDENLPLKWYQSYNDVKHNREIEFEKANFENLILSLAGLFSLLFSQFFFLTYNPYNLHGIITGNYGHYYCSGDSIFSIKLPYFEEREMYDFDWEELKKKDNPYESYNFK